MAVRVIGLDTAKHVFQVHGADASGRAVLRKRLRRSQVPYLRMLLIHGARSVLYRCVTKTDSRSRWIAEKKKTLGTTKACVAVANKNARIIWALLARDEPYRAAA